MRWPDLYTVSLPTHITIGNGTGRVTVPITWTGSSYAFTVPEGLPVGDYTITFTDADGKPMPLVWL